MVGQPGHCQEDHELVSLGKNLTKLMHAKGVDTKELSALTGVSISLLNALKRSEGNPTLGTLITLANFFDVPIGSLVTPDGLQQEATTFIPVYDLHSVHQREQVTPSTHICLSLEEDAASQDYFAVHIDNASLMPFFDKGSIFIVSKNKPYADGDMVLVRINNEHNVLRKVFVKNKGLLFHYIALDAKPHAYDHYDVLGTVDKVIHNMGL